jgi:hypothetical protein
MVASALTADLASLLSTVRRPGDFYVAATAEFLAPSLEVEGVGGVALPLLPVQAKQLIAAADPAPFGRGEDTIVDTAVRRCWQIGPDRVRLGGRRWAKTLDTILTRAAEGLGVDEPIEAQFYKLLVYDRGSFFVGHRDTEKADGMFATLLVVLPSNFAGGELVVRHKGREVRLDLRCQDPAEVAFAAFYADCVHEVLPVTDGYRLVLVYNLLRRGRAGRGRALEPPDYEAQQARVAALLQRWRKEKAQAGDSTPEKLVYLLDHAYTPAELGFSALKGADAAVAGVLTAAAREARCSLHLALLTIEESGAAEYAGTYGRWRGGWHDEDAFEAGEVSDRATALSDWRRPDGEAPALGEIPVGEEEISPPRACEELDPDEEHFSEATGNEGASFERTYRRAALVLWLGERLSAVLSKAGLSVALPYLQDLVRRWADGPSDEQASLRRQAHDLASHMLTRWPKQLWRYRHKEGLSEVGQALALLVQLGDTDLIERALTEVVAAGSFGKGDTETIIGALNQLPPPGRGELVERIVAGTGSESFDLCANLLARAATTWRDNGLANLEGAAARLLQMLPGDPVRAKPRAAWESGPEMNARVVVNLLTGLCAIDGRLAEQAIDRILAWRDTYGMDAILVPAARQLFSAGAKTPPALERLRTACLAHVRARLAEPLAPPTDWRRDSALPCRCRLCTMLARFLANPEHAAWTLKAAEADRSHVEQTIKQARCDVGMHTDRRGRPYSLICTKNQASYERRAKQRTQDLKDVAKLEI